MSWRVLAKVGKPRECTVNTGQYYNQVQHPQHTVHSAELQIDYRITGLYTRETIQVIADEQNCEVQVTPQYGQHNPTRLLQAYIKAVAGKDVQELPLVETYALEVHNLGYVPQSDRPESWHLNVTGQSPPP